jgi:hypothetical protein
MGERERIDAIIPFPFLTEPLAILQDTSQN